MRYLLIIPLLSVVFNSSAQVQASDASPQKRTDIGVHVALYTAPCNLAPLFFQRGEKDKQVLSQTYFRNRPLTLTLERCGAGRDYRVVTVGDQLEVQMPVQIQLYQVAYDRVLFTQPMKLVNGDNTVNTVVLLDNKVNDKKVNNKKVNNNMVNSKVFSTSQNYRLEVVYE